MASFKLHTKMPILKVNSLRTKTEYDFAALFAYFIGFQGNISLYARHLGLKIGYVI